MPARRPDTTVRRTTVRQASVRQATVRQATVRQASVRQATGRQATGRQATGRQATGRQATGPETTALSRAELTAIDTIRAELSRAARYDDESIVHARWVRQRYDCGCYATYAPARQAAVRTAWHEAGHAVAALTVGARFSSASIHHGHRSEGRVHHVAGAGAQAFVVDAAGQLAERLMTWTMLERDADLREWLGTWQADGGDARRFRQSIGAGFGADEVAAWRHCEQLLTPKRLQIRQLARALLVYPRHLPYNVAAALAA